MPGSRGAMLIRMLVSAQYRFHAAKAKGIPVMKKYSAHVGADVLVRTVSCRQYVVETGEVASNTFGNCPSAL